MKQRLCFDIRSTDQAIEAWDKLHEGVHEGDRREQEIAVSLARAMMEDASLRDGIAAHIRFCGLPPVVESFLPRLCLLRRQLETTRCRITDLVESDVDAAFLLIRHPQVIDTLLDRPAMADSVLAEPVSANVLASAALKSVP